MHLCITAHGIGVDGLRSLDDRLRLLLGSWTCRIRHVRVSLEDVQGRRSGLDVRCVIRAQLMPRGEVTVEGLGTDIEAALGGAARRLARRVKGEFYRARGRDSEDHDPAGDVMHARQSGVNESGGRAG